MPDPLQRFHERSLLEWLDVLRHSPDAEERYRALPAVMALSDGANCVEVLAEAMADADPGVRAGAARGLARFAGAPERAGAAETWATIERRWQELLHDADPDVRFESACGLLHGRFAAEAAVNVLMDALQEPETQPVMLAEILSVLSETRPVFANERLPWPFLLRHDNSAVREQASRAAGVFGSSTTGLSDDLVALLDDEEPFVREESARSLGKLGVSSTKINAALQAASGDEDELVAQAARDALHSILR